MLRADEASRRKGKPKGDESEKNDYLCGRSAGMVELVDTSDLGSDASRRGGSSPFSRTKEFVRLRASSFFICRMFLSLCPCQNNE